MENESTREAATSGNDRPRALRVKQAKVKAKAKAREAAQQRRLRL